MSVSMKRLRKLERTAHLAAAALLFAYLYLPQAEGLGPLVRLVVFPLLTMSGFGMWKGAWVLRKMRRRTYLSSGSR